TRESSADYHSEWVFRGGAFELAFMLGWTLGLARGTLPRLASGEDLARRLAELDQAAAEIGAWHRRLPLNPTPLLAGLEDWYNDHLSHPDDSAFWHQWSIARQHAEIEAPITHMGGWFDIFLAGTLNNYAGLRANARTPAARAAQRLIVGPWVHGPWNLALQVQGEVDFGPESLRDYHQVRLPWFDHWLKGRPAPAEPRVQLFVMGENRWRTADDYPLPGTRYAPWYLHAGGRLDEQPAVANEAPDTYTYDPNDPVPTLGGATLQISAGAYDQRPIESRCLTYTSDPLPRDLTIIGPVRCLLAASSSAPDTDWVVRLTDVSPDGFSRLLCDGILRARYRDSAETPSLLAPGEIYEFDVDLWATANTFLAGHRLRVAVTSSSFPRWDRNPNTGGVFGADTQVQTAANTIYHAAAHASRIMLPVID
ncbi:MAG: CocE/NonD family hydrolase, partial [Burkholderiaceae bacterium]